MDNLQNSQAILDSDDEMDDIMTEFAKAENESETVELSSDSSDEMDSLLDEFAKANNQSDSNTKEKKYTKVVLSSEDDKEIENILEDFRKENTSDNLPPLKDENEIIEDKAIVFDTDNQNGIIYNNSFEILLSHDSGDKSSDENAFKSTVKESPRISLPQLPEFKNIKFNLKQEPEYENESNITIHDSECKSALDNGVIASSDSCIKLPCKKKPNLDISQEQNILQDELNSNTSELNRESKIYKKEPFFNNNSSLCNDSEVSLNYPINKANFHRNLSEENYTESSQENAPSLNIKITSVSSIQNSINNAVFEDSKQNLIYNLEDSSNANALSLPKLVNNADESNSNKIKTFVPGLEDRVPNAVLQNESSPIKTIDVCETNEKVETKNQNLNCNEVSCNGGPISGEESSKRHTEIMMKNDQVHSESQPEFFRPFNSSNYPTSNNFFRNRDTLEIQEESYYPTSVPSTSSVTQQVSKRRFDPSDSSIISIHNLEYKKPPDHLAKYFQSIEETVRTFPVQIQLEAKKRISEIVSELEYKTFFLQNDPPLYRYSHQHPFHHLNGNHVSHLRQSYEIDSYSGMKHSTPSNSIQTFLSSNPHPFLPSLESE